MAASRKQMRGWRLSQASPGNCCQAPDTRLTEVLKTSLPTDTKTTQAPVSAAAEGDAIELEGKVVTVLPGTMFRVQLANGHVVLAHISGKLRKHYIKIAAGDMVKMEMSPYDMNKARITYRMKETNPTYRAPVRRRY
jgi:translation initiation factor IF-1